LSARCIVKAGRPYMEFLSPQKAHIHAHTFASEDDYHRFRDDILTTAIDNRGNLYHIFVFTVAGTLRNCIFYCFNHLVFDGISALLLIENIQHILLNPQEEIVWHPFSDYLERMERYSRSDKYLVDQAFWENQFAELSNCEYLFPGAIEMKEAPIRELRFQTSHALKRKFLAYCSDHAISPHLLIVTILAELIHAKTNAKRFYFEIPIGNRLGAKERNSIGPYEIGLPIIFDFNQYQDTWDLLDAVNKQSKDYYRHKNFDWNTKIYSEPYQQRYGHYIPQFCFSYFCSNRSLDVPFANWRHLHFGSNNLPMTLYIADYIDREAFTFSYVFWYHYFPDEDVTAIHKDIELRIENIIHSRENQVQPA
jgi:hypothetical protein